VKVAGFTSVDAPVGMNHDADEAWRRRGLTAQILASCNSKFDASIIFF
jgi:hypothetical protein